MNKTLIKHSSNRKKQPGLAKMDSENHLQALRHVSKHPNQRSLAQSLGFSVGKTNYIVKCLMQKGLVKAERFAHSDNKRNYRYVLTPKGITERIKLTENFIERKKQEYELLQQELMDLKGVSETALGEQVKEGRGKQ